MDNTEKFVGLGERLGLKGAELMKFLDKKEQEVAEREERAHARAQQKLDLENQAEEKRQSYEQEMIAQKIALQQLQNNAAIQTAAGNPTPALIGWTPKGPKLPHFDDSKDDMDSYIRRFERYATANNWAKAQYAMYLSTLLRGSALEVYARMASTDVTDYDKLKDALLKRFKMTEEGYRKKFHGSRMDQNETASQFMAKLNDYFLRWTEMAQVGEEREDLVNFLVVEQFIHSCPTDVSIHLREWKLRKMDEVLEAAEAYMEAHATSRSFKGPNQRTQSSRPPAEPQAERSRSESRPMTPSGSSRTESQPYRSEGPVCWLCNKRGHKANQCKIRQKIAAAVQVLDEMQSDEEEGDDQTYDDDDTHSVATCLLLSDVHKCSTRKPVSTMLRTPTIGGGCLLPEDQKLTRGLPTVTGLVNNQTVTILRDTGCSGAIIRRSLVTPRQLTNKMGQYVSVDKTVRSAPQAEFHLESPVYSGVVKALCIDDPLCDVILGNLPQVVRQESDILHRVSTSTQNQAERSKQRNQTRDNGKEKATRNKTGSVALTTEDMLTAQAVATRSQDRAPKKVKQLKVPNLAGVGDAKEFKEHQASDPTLHQARKWAEINKVKINEQTGETTSFTFQKQLLYRVVSRNNVNAAVENQLVVPQKYRNTVMSLGHESAFAGHMGITKTTHRIQSNFYWPSMHDDIGRFCKSCDICQRTIPKGRIPKAPLVSLPVINTPFYRVAVDLVGPLHPMSTRGHRYILTMVDMATRYPKAAALSNIDSITVAEALLKMFSDTGIPNEVLSDRGTQFTSDIMKEVHRLLSIRAVNTSPYHAQCNGLCEKYNGTLKQMLKRMLEEQPREWDRFIEPLLFAYREVPIDSLGGFSPFEVLYGRTVRGPMSVLKELWSNSDVEPETRDTYEYVLDLKNRLQETCQIAHTALIQAQQVQKKYFDKKTAPRKLKAGDEVLLFLPTDHNKLLSRWKGPFGVKDQLGVNNYVIEINGRSKVFHINMLKQYFRREPQPVQASVATITFESDGEDEAAGILELSTGPKVETYKDVNIGPDLNAEQRQDLRALVKEYADIFSSNPGETNIIEHRIELTDLEPVRKKPYPVPYAMYDEVKKELDSMLQMGIIEPSESPYCSPLVMVKKKDGSLRPCQDMRAINRITKFDCEGMPDPDAIYARLSGSKFFSKLDFCKGYWQIPMEASSKEVTGFTTPFGHYQFRKMPFGLVNSGATYAKMMRKLLKDTQQVEHFVDDVLEHTMTWQEHMTVMRDLFERIRKGHLTIKPSKCYLGFLDIEFTGHLVQGGMLKPLADKVEKIKNAPPPQTKKQLRSLLGLCGYYRKFIPNYAELAVPLTDLTKKGVPDQLRWTTEHTQVLNTLKDKLCQEPILKLPDVERTFVLRTDASDVGVGAVLLQDYDGVLFPVAYISKKLETRERNYSVIERECLALVWAISKLKVYLYGREFILQTDHQSLSFLNRAKFENQRVMRWALALQPYRFRVEYIRGEQNTGADFLSRNMV